MRMFNRLLVGSTLATFSLSVLAHPAHPESVSAQPLWIGMLHALSGLDHLALLLLLALWLRQCGCDRCPGVPLTAGMMVGALMLQSVMHGLVFDGLAAAPAFTFGLTLGSLTIVIMAAILGRRVDFGTRASLAVIGRSTSL